jgi:hypothetical protein
MSRVHLYILAGFLAVFAIAMMAFKVVVAGFPLFPHTLSEVWRVEVQLSFEATGGPVKLALHIPSETRHVSVIDQQLAARGFGMSTERTEENLEAVYSIRTASGRQYLYYRVLLDVGRPAAGPREPPPTSRAPAFRADELLVAQTIVDRVRAQSADPHTLAKLIMKEFRDPKPDSGAAYLVGRNAMAHRVSAVVTDVIRLAGIPARVVNGLALLPERRNAHFTRWVEVYDGDRWFAVYPGDLSREAERHLVPWWRGRIPLAKLEGGTDLQHDVTTARTYEAAIRAVVQRQRVMNNMLIEYSLFGLPLQTQLLFRTLLTIPLGVLLLVILRNVVGFKTFGTFMPVLIALAFRQTGLAGGLVFFSIVLAIGLSVRFYLERLKLLLVPRLASLLIVVVLAIAALTVVSHQLGIGVGLSIGLFPIVILTMTIERMTIAWEERGPAEALQQALGSLVVAAVCFLLVRHEQVQHLFFVFPEVLLLVLSITLLLGRYTGYRLLELRRFRELAK